METRELDGVTFACLEGCGFCCTFQPEVSTRELALLRARFRPKPLAVTSDGTRTYLGLQNKCGACTLLERRACTAYDLRPAHCRYFPFHVHFGETTEAYVNYTCRGVVRSDATEAPAGGLHAAFDAAVLQSARADAMTAQADEARATYAEFKRRAMKAGAWGDARAVAADATRAGGAMFTARWLQEAVGRAGEDAPLDGLVQDALAPFGADDVTKRPFYLAPDLRWITFETTPALRALEMDERGDLRPIADLGDLAGWSDLAPPAADALAAYVQRLTQRGVFAGGVYAIVDDTDYESTVEEATWWRLVEVVVDLAVRARVLVAMGTPADRLADETARFYDSTFLDAPTIGGFL